MISLALIVAILGAPLAPPSPHVVLTFSGGAHADIADGAPVWTWYAEHCGELFAMGEADTATEARAALDNAIARHAARSNGMCDAPSHPYAEDGQ